MAHDFIFMSMKVSDRSAVAKAIAEKKKQERQAATQSATAAYTDPREFLTVNELRTELERQTGQSEINRRRELQHT